MATAISADDPTPNQNLEKPNHIIIWLDKYIGNPNEYMHLKKAFATNIDPRHETWTMINDKDLDAAINVGTEMLVEFEGVKFLLQAFNNEDACVASFENHQDKRVFFITSGSMGVTAVPRIIEHYRQIFTDPISNQAYPSVYIFCLHIKYHLEWIGDYLEYIQAFTTESELLERMIRDVAGYFILRSERILPSGGSKSALQYLHWAKMLQHQYDKMQQGIQTDNPREVRLSEGMRRINEKIEAIENAYPQQESSDNETTDTDNDVSANHDLHVTHNVCENRSSAVGEHPSHNDDDDDDDDDDVPVGSESY